MAIYDEQGKYYEADVDDIHTELVKQTAEQTRIADALERIATALESGR